MLAEAERRYLLDLARKTIADRLGVAAAPPPARPENTAALRTHRGAFVTLHARGRLRGCIGYIQADRPIEDVVVDAAAAAAFSDFRFAPVANAELAGLSIEISVLTRPVRTGAPEEVQVGRHGIIISRGHSRGLLLPQVATEHSWDRATFLSQGCLKAGLPPDAWQKGATIEVFEAEVFGEANA
ncbi:MAG: AmmeMemoRadiSam system protein A [Acidobacteriota bacterium]